MVFDQFDPSAVPEDYNWVSTICNGITYFEAEPNDVAMVTLALTNTLITEEHEIN